MPDYAADPAKSARKPVPPTRKTAPQKAVADGLETLACLPLRQPSAPTGNFITHRQPVPVRIPG